MSKEMESLKFAKINKKIRRTATKWAGFNLMLYVLYGLGIVNILEDMKVEKKEQLRLYTAANQPFVHRQDYTGIQERIPPGRRAGGRRILADDMHARW
ncbi:hypothetical protein CW713_06645 [Methanophagales archaeon]|nr:MAG: hypothetical protein CW713_06645 [Methanophagales archaeon]